MADSDSSLNILITTRAELSGARQLEAALERDIGKAKALGAAYGEQAAKLQKVRGSIFDAVAAMNTSHLTKLCLWCHTEKPRSEFPFYASKTCTPCTRHLGRRKYNTKLREDSRKLGPRYIRKLLKSKFLRGDQIPKALVSAKRAQLSLKRLCLSQKI